MALSLASVSATAFVAPAVQPRATAPSMAADSDFCYGLPGNIKPAGNFDPANLLEGTSKAEVMRWREAELAHGRVGMLASAGFLVQESFHPLFSGDNGPAIEQIPALPPWVWFVMTLGIGAAEASRVQIGWANPYESMENVQALKPEYYPGDLGFDPLGLKPEDSEELRIMQEKELSHGRLAMIAAAGFLGQEAATGKTWGEQDISLENLLFGGYFSQEAAEIARDAAL